jgi:hypothetical protein
MQLFQLYYLSMLDLYESIQKNKLDVIPQASILSYHPKKVRINLNYSVNTIYTKIVGILKFSSIIISIRAEYNV